MTGACVSFKCLHLTLQHLSFDMPQAVHVCRVAHQLPSLTEQALGLSATVKFQDSLSGSSASDASVPPVLTCGTQAASLGCSMPSGSPSWLTPQQLHDRPLGELCTGHHSRLLLVMVHQCISLHTSAINPNPYVSANACNEFSVGVLQA